VKKHMYKKAARKMLIKLTTEGHNHIKLLGTLFFQINRLRCLNKCLKDIFKKGTDNSQRSYKRMNVQCINKLGKGSSINEVTSLEEDGFIILILQGRSPVKTHVIS